jgi:exopolysaccharide biosynthesis protein
MKKNKKKSKIKLSKFTYFVIGLDFLVTVALVIIYTPIVSFKNFWIPTAMTTMSHRYLAYTLYSEKSVDDVMSANYIVGVNEKVNLNDIVIDTNGSKKHYTSKYEQEMFNKDPDNDVYKIIRIQEENFKGYLTVVYDPSDVDLAVPKKLGKMGQSVAKLCVENDGLVGINGGGFEDLDGWGNGSTPYGSIIKDGKLIWTHDGGSGGLIGFTKDHKMYLTNDAPAVAIKDGMEDAWTFPYCQW